MLPDCTDGIFQETYAYDWHKPGGRISSQGLDVCDTLVTALSFKSGENPGQFACETQQLAGRQECKILPATTILYQFIREYISGA